MLFTASPDGICDKNKVLCSLYYLTATEASLNHHQEAKHAVHGTDERQASLLEIFVFKNIFQVLQRPKNCLSDMRF